MFASIHIVIVEDNPVTLLGLQTMLEGQPDYHLSATFTNVRSLFRYCDDNRPDLLILDDSVPGWNTLDILSYIQFNFKWLKVLVYGSRVDLLEIRKYQQLGAVGYLYKDEQSPTALLDALNGIKVEPFYCSPLASSRFVNAISDGRTLPKRSHQVLHAMAEGLSVGKIADKLGISRKAVYSAQDRLREQFGVETNEAVIASAIAQGILRPPNGSDPKA